MAQSLTPEKRLRTGRSVWSEERVPHVPLSALRKSIRCRIAIVGAGVSGAFMANELGRVFSDVVVLDRRLPAMGSTHASTAMLQYEIDTPLIRLSDKIGHAKAAQAWRLSQRTTGELIKLVREENIFCDLAERSSLYLAGPTMGSRAMGEEARARRRASIDCEFLSAASLKARYGITRAAAIWSSGSAAANPVELTRGLLRLSRAKGVRVYAPCEVRGVVSNKSGVVLDAGGYFVEAGAAVFCTGYETIHGLPTTGTRIVSSWAAATPPNTSYPGWLDDTLLWEAADPYLYLRTDGRGRLIVGGEDADIDSHVYRANTLNLKARKLEEKTRRLLSGVRPKWTHVWAGAFGESADGLPIIDNIPDMKHCFTVMGFGGNGTIYSLIAARLMPSLIKGKPLKDATLFRFR